MHPDLKGIFSVAAGALTLYLFIPYIQSIRRGSIRPHVFSWIVWGGGTLVVCFAQLAGGAGLGAWPIGLSGVITLYIAALAYVKRADISVTRLDWVFLCAALSALPLWFATADPLWAVIILTVADLLGFGPTFRSAFHHPHRESLTFFGGAAIRNLLVVLALETYSYTTVLFPAAVGAACLLLVLLLIVRRRAVPS